MRSCPYCSNPIDESNPEHCLHCGATLASQVLLEKVSLQEGKYTIVRVLGQGGFGTTYEALQHALEQRVCIKELFPSGCYRKEGRVVPPHGVNWPEWMESFLSEGKLLTQFQDPGIVRVYDVFQENNTSYLVMEFLEGETLEALLAREVLLEPAKVRNIAECMAEALHVVHSRGILHRDIKPGNIFITRSGRLILIDFGSARRFMSGFTVSQTRLVTVGYAAPEQYAEKARFGPYTDLYALGATLFRAATGQTPPSSLDRMMGEPLAVDRLKSLPAGLFKAIEGALQLGVTDRPQSAQAFLRILKSSGNASGRNEILLVNAQLKMTREALETYNLKIPFAEIKDVQVREKLMVAGYEGGWFYVVFYALKNTAALIIAFLIWTLSNKNMPVTFALVVVFFIALGPAIYHAYQYLVARDRKIEYQVWIEKGRLRLKVFDSELGDEARRVAENIQKTIYPRR